MIGLPNSEFTLNFLDILHILFIFGCLLLFIEWGRRGGLDIELIIIFIHPSTNSSSLSLSPN